MKNDYVPPVIVRVANSYSATLNPALLCAVILSTYQVAGSRSANITFKNEPLFVELAPAIRLNKCKHLPRTTKLPPGFTAFEIWFHSAAPLEIEWTRMKITRVKYYISSFHLFYTFWFHAVGFSIFEIYRVYLDSKNVRLCLSVAPEWMNRFRFCLFLFERRIGRDSGVFLAKCDETVQDGRHQKWRITYFSRLPQYVYLMKGACLVVYYIIICTTIQNGRYHKMSNFIFSPTLSIWAQII